jgi:uncharacterized protein involved in exopolysaccharide biosynthesis
MLEEDRANREGASSAATARELAMVLFRQSRLFTGIAALVFLMFLAYAIAGTSYRAHFKVLVRRGRSDPPVTGQQNAPPDFSRVEVTEEELNSEAELIRDDDVLRQVAESDDLASHDWLRWLHPGDDQAARTERATKRLAGRLNVEGIKKTNLISVSYDAADPKLAARVLTTLSKVYLEKHMRVHRPEGQLRFFDRQTVESRKQLEEAKLKLLKFTRKRGVVSAALQRDLMLQRVENLEAVYGQSQVETASTERRVQALEKEMSDLPRRAVTQIRTSDNPELARALKATLLDLQLKKTQLLTKFEPGHQLLQEVERQIQQARAAITDEELTPVRDETTDKDSEYEWANGELQKARVDLTVLQAREAASRPEIGEYLRTARSLGEDAITQGELVSDEKASEESYLLYVRKREEARMGDALDQGGIVNVAIAEEPVVPALPVWPPAVVALAGLVGALVSGTGAAFVADYLDPALRTPEEVLVFLDLPVLASLPATKKRTRLSA